jgi:hypothetical protein
MLSWCRDSALSSATKQAWPKRANAGLNAETVAVEFSVPLTGGCAVRARGGRIKVGSVSV